MGFFVNGNGIPDPWNILYAAYFAFGFAAARFFLDRYIFSRVAPWLLNASRVKLRLDKATRVKVAKCSESLWKFMCYATAEICVLLITYREPWFRDTKEYFRGWPNQALKLPLELYYMAQCGFYIYSIVALLTWETRRKDFPVMMSHHVITIILIGCSYITRFFRVGSIILVLHDASDVFMEVGKVFKYSDNELGASACFGLFAISWLILRLIFFPFWVIKATGYDLIDFLKPSASYPRFLYYVFNTMLLTLLVFHIYWWCLIWAMMMSQLKNWGKVGEDIRSDLEDDD